MITAFPIFNKYPDLAARIGRLVVYYGELEFELFMCVADVIEDREIALRVLFRPKGEEARVHIADALIRKKVTEAGLAGPYEAVLAALRWCRTLRNQYAHSHWSASSPTLAFYNLDEASEASTLREAELKYYPVDDALLREQDSYFQYTSLALKYLHHEFRFRQGQAEKNPFSMPRQLQKPRRHNRQD